MEACFVISTPPGPVCSSWSVSRTRSQPTPICCARPKNRSYFAETICVEEGVKLVVAELWHVGASLSVLEEGRSVPLREEVQRGLYRTVGLVVDRPFGSRRGRRPVACTPGS
jgi:hypothetical protein